MWTSPNLNRTSSHLLQFVKSSPDMPKLRMLLLTPGLGRKTSVIMHSLSLVQKYKTRGLKAGD